jgi:thiol-disulfide isomerase/thioredoxin
MTDLTGKPSPTSTRKWLAVGIAVVIVWVLIASSSRKLLNVGEMEPPVLDMTEIPRPLDFRWTLEDLDGQPVDFARFKGRPILLNLWATWCPPCVKEMPSIAALASSEELKGRDIAFVCVATDESAAAVRSFLKDKGWPMTMLRATSVPPAFQTEGIPATFLISPDGRVVTGEMGAANWNDPSVVYALQKLANMKAK